MNKYEFTFLLNDDSELSKLKDLLSEHEAKVTKEEKWGKRELAYPINKITEAEYFTWMLEVPASQIKALKNKLNFNEKLIRYLLLKVD